MIGDNYRPEDYSNNVQEGENFVRIASASQRYSTAGNEMIELEFSIVGNDNFKLKYFLVDGEYFNKNATRFFDCFRIQRGNFNMRSWIGKTGTVYLEYGEPNGNGKRYLQITKLVVEQNQDTSSVQNKQSTPPARNQQQSAPHQQEEFEEDIPF